MLSEIAGGNSTLIRTRGARTLALAAALLTSVALIFTMIYRADAAAPANSYFETTWERTDQPVISGQVDRTWLWGPDGFTGEMTEPYADSPGGERTVQYFDKSRMEITDPSAPTNSVWYVTNGLLVVELVTGRMQMGDDSFTQYQPADVNIAGDRDGTTGPTYATMAGLLDAPALSDGATITQRVDRNGNVTNDPSLAGSGVTADYLVSVPGIEHQVASPFWAFMNSSGTVYENGVYSDAPMFLSAFYATGYPITEAYWAEVKVAGTYQDVLLQCFERRCLTYTPNNAEGWQVEAGNVGQHYYEWRYGQVADEEQPDGTPRPSSTATATATGPVNETPTADPSASATPTAPGDVPTATAPTTPTPAHEPYRYAFDWGGPVDPDAELDGPLAIEMSADGFHVYITEYGKHRVHKYTTDGLYVTSWGGEGEGEGQFKTPRGIAVDGQGRVYVTDYQNDRVQIFDANGTYIDEFGEEGNGTSQLNGPRGIAIDSAGSIYVADSVNGRVQKFDRFWMYVDHWGDVAGDGELQSPMDVAIDSNDIVYVTDSSLNAVKKYFPDGVFIDKWGDSGSGDGVLAGPIGIAISDLDILYVADSGKDQIQAFDLDGTFLGKWNSSDSSSGDLYYPIGVATDVYDNVYVTDENGYLHKFGPRGKYLDSWSDGRREKITPGTSGFSMDALGFVYLSDSTYDRIQVLNAYGQFQHEFGEPGSGAGQLESVTDVAPAPGGYLYAVDVTNSRVLKFERNGAYVTEWSGGGLSEPFAVAVDQDGNVYVANTGNDTLQKFDSAGTLIDTWGEFGDDQGQFNDPVDIAIDGDRVYVLDFGNARVQVFDRDGTFLGGWGESGEGDGQFLDPAGIAVDRKGFVYVADTGNHRFQKFTHNGAYLTKLGSEGSGDGQLNTPTRIAVGFNDIVYVLDAGNYRVQMFEQPSNPLVFP